MTNKKQLFKPGEKRKISAPNGESREGIAGYIHSPQTLREFAILSDALSRLPELRERNIDLRTIPNSYRTINYWESVGVLDDYRNPPGQGWRKFSIMDMAFLAVITQLRESGLSIEKIKRAKDGLNGTWLIPIEKDGEMVLGFPDSPSTVLEFAFMRVIGSGKYFEGNTYLMVDNTGHAELMTEQDLLLNRTAGILPDNYFYMNLNALFKDYIGDNFVSVLQECSQIINPRESRVLECLREAGANETISVRKAKGVITFINREFTTNPSGELHNLINALEDGEIRIKVRNFTPKTALIIKHEEFSDEDVE
jgi:hypothetical protein